MTRFYIVLFFICLIITFVSSCKSDNIVIDNTHLQKNKEVDLSKTVEYEPIVVGFYKGMIETNKKITEEDMIMNFGMTDINDTIII